MLRPPRLLWTAALGGVLLVAYLFTASTRAVQQPPGTRPSPAASPTVDARQFGAVGDGKSDDTAALQRALAGGGQVTLARGTYRISRPLVIDLANSGFCSVAGGGVARLEMHGPGPALHIKGNHGGTADPHTVNQSVWDRERMPLVDGLEIVGKHPESCGIQSTGAMQLTITRCVIRRVLHAIHLTGRNRNVIVADCHLYENRGIGVYYDDVNLHQSNITGSHISYNLLGGVVSRAGNVRNIQISGCDIEGNMGPDGPPTANVLIDTRGGSAATAEVAVVGCTIQHTHNAPDSANVRFLGIDRGDQAAWGNVTICDNVLSDAQVNIDLIHCRGVTVTGNTLWKGYTHDLRMKECRNVVISANTFDNNPRYHYGDGDDAKHGIWLDHCRDCTLNSLQVFNPRFAEGGLVLTNCTRCNITNCSVTESAAAAFVLRNCSHCRISDSLAAWDEAEHAGIALRIEKSAQIMVEDNLLGGRTEIDADSRLARQTPLR